MGSVGEIGIKQVVGRDGICKVCRTGIQRVNSSVFFTHKIMLK